MTRTRHKIQKQLLSLLMALTLVLGMIPVNVFAATVGSTAVEPYNGKPVTPTKISSTNYMQFGLTSDNWSTYNGYYGIRNASELYGFASMVNGGKTKSNAVLLQDIVINTTVSETGAKYSWTPIGTLSNEYLGTFDGNGCTISGLYVKTSNGTIGLFGYAGKYTEKTAVQIKNIVLANSYIYSDETDSNSTNAVAGIVGELFGNYVQISNCRISSDVTIRSNEAYEGGIVGEFGATSLVDSRHMIKNCVFLGKMICDKVFSIQNDRAASRHVGAITGSYQFGSNAAVYVKTENCYYLKNCISGKCQYYGQNEQSTYINYGKGGADYRYNTNAGCTILEAVTDTHTCVSVTHKEVKANCSYPGCSEYSYCLICNKVLSGSKRVTGVTTEHVYDGKANCQTYNTCLLCGAKGQKDTTKHAGNAYTYTNINKTQHAVYYKCCNSFYKNEDHVFKGGDCQTQQTCERCGASGDICADVHSSTEYRYEPSRTNKQQHNIYHACCSAYVGSEAHNGTLIYRVHPDDHTKHNVYASCCNGLLETVEHTWKNGICQYCEGYEEPEKSGDVYQIKTVGNLMWFAQYVNAGNYSVNAKLMTDLDMKGMAWIPIARMPMSDTASTGYTGTFDGNGHVIFNITVATPEAATSNGLFGTITTGTVKNLGISQLSFDNNDHDHRAGGIAGQLMSGGTIENCYVIDSTIKASSRVVGGIVGLCKGTVKNCYTKGLTLAGYKNRFGGITGDYKGGKIENCYTDYSALGSTTSSVGTTDESSKAGVSSEMFASGKVTYLLNRGVTDGTQSWYQNLTGENVQAYPQFQGGTVYCSKDQYVNEIIVTITGVSIENGIYNGLSHAGYTGTPTNTEGYDGNYVITYQGRNTTIYSSKEAPVHAGDYTVIISTDGSMKQYKGSVSLDFSIEKKEVQVTLPEQKIAKGEQLSKESVKVGTLLDGDSATVEAVTKNTDCTYSAMIVIKNVNKEDVTNNYSFTNTGTYHEYEWNTDTHQYQCINCSDVDNTDHTIPTAKYQIGTNGFKQFINTITFGLFCKDYQTVEIVYEDDNSGVDVKQYYVSDKEISETELSSVVWNPYSDPLNLDTKGSYFIYVRVVDQAGNVAIYNSEGIVIFEDSTSRTSIEYIRTTKEDVKAEIAYNGNTIKKVTYGEQILIAGTDYTVTDSGILFASDFLETLAASDSAYEIVVSYNAGGVTWGEDSYGTAPTDTKILISVKLENGSVSEISDISKTYDGNVVSNATYTSLSKGKVTYEYKLFGTDDSTFTTTVPKNAGKYVVRVTVAADENYKEASATAEFTIAPRALTVKAEDKSKIYGAKNPDLTWKITKGALAESDELENISASRVEGEDADTYDINLSQAEGANPNYDITFETGTFTIQPKTIGIVWGNTSFIYNGETKIPTATATGVEFDDDITFTVSGGKVDANIGSETYTATVTGIAGEKAGNYQLPSDVTTTFTIGKADQSAPSGLNGIPEDIDEKRNGKITGVDSTMEYRKDEETAYTSVTEGVSELTDLADGTYYIRYKANANHNASPETKIVLRNDAKLIVTIPEVQNGYTLNVDQTELKWNDSVVLTFKLKDGYSKLNNFAVKVNGNPITLDTNGKCTVTNAQSDIIVTVVGVADITAPTATITVGENSWNSFFNKITFGLFFKETQKVTISAEDVNIGSGLDQIYYYLSTLEMTENEVKAITDEQWTEYKGEFSIKPQEEYIIYAKATDKAGNTVYISSEQGIIVDTIAPVISNVENGGTYYGNTTFTVTDTHIDVVKVDNKVVTLTDGKYTITADDQEHTIIAIDKSQNSSAMITITVITIESLDDSIEHLSTFNVKSSDKTAIDDVYNFLYQLKNSGKEFTDEENRQIDTILNNCRGMIDQIARIGRRIANTTDQINAYDIETVKSTDKQTITDLISDMEKLLSGNNLTEAERTALSEVKATAEGLVQRIDDTAASVKDLTDKVNAYDIETVKSIDKQTITDLISDMEELLSGNNLTEDEKPALSAVKVTAENLIQKINDITARTKDLTDKVNAYDIETVKSTDKQTITDLIIGMEELLSGKNLTEAEKTALNEVKATAEGLVQKIEAVTSKAGNLSDVIRTCDINQVTSDHKEYISGLITEMEELLNGNNLTEAEKTNLSEVKEIAEGLVQRIDDTAASMKDLTDKVNAYDIETVKSTDKQTITNLITGMEELLSGKNLTEAEKTALSAVKATAENLIQKIDDIAARTKDLADKVNVYDIETVKSTDKQAITDLITGMEELLNGNNLTEAEKTNLSEVKEIAEGLVQRIDDTAASMKDLTDKVNAYDIETVKSTDKQTITDLIAGMEELLSGKNLTEEEKDELGKVKSDAEELLKKIEEADLSSDTENTDKVKDIVSDNVTIEDKTDLEKAKDDLEKALEDYDGNLTEEEKDKIKDELDRIEKALDVIKKVEDVKDLIDKLPKPITKKDADAIKNAEEGYNALSKYEQSLLDKEVKEKLERAKSELDKLNQMTVSPTGDSMNLWMWVAAFFVSGAGLAGTTAYSRKKKQTKK